MFTRQVGYDKLQELMREKRITSKQVDALLKGLQSPSLKMCNYTLGLIAKL